MSVSVHATRDAQVATPARCSRGNPSAMLKWKLTARWSSGHSQRNAHVATSSRPGEQRQPPSVITVKHLGPCSSQLRRLGVQSSRRTSLTAALICTLTPTHRRCIEAVSCARHAGTTGCTALACAAALSCWMCKLASATRARRPTCGVGNRYAKFRLPAAKLHSVRARPPAAALALAVVACRGQRNCYG
jgi:hypothetical protein